MFFVNEDGGLNTAGYVLTAIVIFLLLIVASAIAGGRKKISTRQLAFAAVALALGSVLSMIKVIHLPMGGEITLFSMLIVSMVGYWYGPAVGLLAGVAFGFLQMILDAYIISIPQMLVDYPFAFGALGLTGFFAGKKNGLLIGYAVAVVGRFFFALLSGIIFFGMYAPEGMSPFAYSALYNGSYIFGEGILTIIILAIPAVRAALLNVKMQAQMPG